MEEMTEEDFLKLYSELSSEKEDDVEVYVDLISQFGEEC